MNIELFDVQVLLLVNNVIEVNLGLRQVPTPLKTVFVHLFVFVLFQIL
jgi:hypothetical protein